jgi:hypothetical protein
MAIPGAETFLCFFCNKRSPVAGHEKKIGPIKVKDLTLDNNAERVRPEWVHGGPPRRHGFVKASDLPRREGLR